MQNVISFQFHLSNTDVVEIISTSSTLGGKPRIKGTRVSAEQVYEMYSIRGMSIGKIAEELPTVSREQVKKAVEFMETRKDSGQALKA